MGGHQLANWLTGLGTATAFLHKFDPHPHDGHAGAAGHEHGDNQEGHGDDDGHQREEFSSSSSRAVPAAQPTLDRELSRLTGPGVVRVDLLNNNNSQYYGDFTLGNPKQRFTAVFDTGSSVTWVPGAKCQSATCLEHHRFGDAGGGGPTHDDSGGSSGVIHYGTGEVKYEGSRDSLTFCDSHENAGCHGQEGLSLHVPDQPFGMATAQTDYPFRILPFDGILGLAPSVNKGSVLHQLKAAKALPRNVMGVYLSEDTHRSGSVAFGGIEPHHVAPGSPLHWHRIQGPSEWNLRLKDVVVDGEPLHLCEKRPGGTCPAIVDTGSSLVTGPTGEIEKLLAKISTSKDCSGLERMPEVGIQLVDRDGHVVTYPLTPNDYVLRSQEEVPGSGDSGYFKEFPHLGKGGKAPDIQNRCEPGIGVMDVPGRKWVLGDTFLRRFYSIYDDDRGLVGLVRSIHPDEPAPGRPAGAAAMAAATKAALPASLGLVAPLLAGCRVRTQLCSVRSAWARFL